MIFYDNIISDLENTSEIIDKINEGTAVYNVYLVCIPSKGENLLHILSSYEALKEVNSKCNYLVLALAEGKEQAFETAKEILKNWYDARGSFSGFKKFYSSKV